MAMAAQKTAFCNSAEFLSLSCIFLSEKKVIGNTNQKVNDVTDLTLSRRCFLHCYFFSVST